MDYQEPEYYLFPPKEQYYILKKKIRAFAWGAITFFILGFLGGYGWCYKQIVPDYESKIIKLKEQNEHKKDNWSPNKETETKIIKGKKK